MHRKRPLLILFSFRCICNLITVQPNFIRAPCARWAFRLNCPSYLLLFFEIPWREIRKQKLPSVGDTVYPLQRISLVLRILCRLKLTVMLPTTLTCNNRTDQNAFYAVFYGIEVIVFMNSLNFWFIFLLENCVFSESLTQSTTITYYRCWAIRGVTQSFSTSFRIIF